MDGAARRAAIKVTLCWPALQVEEAQRKAAEAAAAEQGQARPAPARRKQVGCWVLVLQLRLPDRTVCLYAS